RAPPDPCPVVLNFVGVETAPPEPRRSDREGARRQREITRPQRSGTLFSGCLTDAHARPHFHKRSTLRKFKNLTGKLIKNPKMNAHESPRRSVSIPSFSTNFSGIG